MKVLLKFLIIFISTSLTVNCYAFPELPFCPGGGPPGWMNYFNDKREQNIWRRYSQYSSPAYSHQSYYKPGHGFAPASRSNFNRPYKYSAPPYSYNRNYFQPEPTPFRNN